MVDPRDFALTWDDHPGWDDVVPHGSRNVIDRIVKENRGKESCPHLKKMGERFFYCSARAVMSDNYNFTDRPTPNSSQYHSGVDYFELQLWCMKPVERHEKCIFFQEARGKVIDG